MTKAEVFAIALAIANANHHTDATGYADAVVEVYVAPADELTPPAGQPAV